MTEGPDIVWLASYPKCGNTWLRFLISSYFFGPPSSSLEVAEKVPDIHKIGDVPAAAGYDLSVLGAAAGRRSLFVKTHLAASHRHPHWGQTAGAIIVTRNPADVLLSNLNFLRLENTASAQRVTDEQYARIFLQMGGDPRWRDNGFGTLDQHLASWQAATSFPRVCVRYEDLKADTVGTLRGIINFLAPRDGVNEDKLNAAVTGATFERMRELETTEKSAGKKSIFEGSAVKAKRGETFVRGGRTSQGLGHLAPDLDHLLEQRFGLFMDALGYGRRFPGGGPKQGQPDQFGQPGQSGRVSAGSGVNPW